MNNRDAIEQIELVKIMCEGFHCLSNKDAEALNTAIKALEERPTGEWINHQDLFSECSECHFNTAFGLNYCPNCGAKMI